MKPAYKIKLTKKQAKQLKKSWCGSFYAYMLDGIIIELKPVPPKPVEADNAPFFINVKLSDGTK